MPEKVIATWDIHLWCDCPKCLENVDLLDAPDFWDGRRLQIAEHDTPHSCDVEVICPSCEHEFKVDTEY